MSRRLRVRTKLISGALASLSIPLILYAGAALFLISPINFAPVGDPLLSVWFFGLGWMVSALFVVSVFVPVSLAVEAFVRPQQRAAMFAVATCVVSTTVGVMLGDSGLSIAILAGLGFISVMLALALETVIIGMPTR